jgi:hypothetical protein
MVRTFGPLVIAFTILAAEAAKCDSIGYKPRERGTRWPSVVGIGAQDSERWLARTPLSVVADSETLFILIILPSGVSFWPALRM